MAYSDLALIFSALPESDVAQLTDDQNGAVVNEDRVNDAIAKADALIDAFLPAKPEGTTPTVLAQISTSLAIFYMYERQMGTSMPDSVNDSYKRQMDLLKLIQSGKMNIGITVNDTSDTGGTFHKVSKSADDRIFSADTWEMY